MIHSESWYGLLQSGHVYYLFLYLGVITSVYCFAFLYKKHGYYEIAAFVSIIISFEYISFDWSLISGLVILISFWVLSMRFLAWKYPLLLPRFCYQEMK